MRLIFSSSKLTVGIENVTLSIPLRYYLDSVTLILTAPSLQMSRVVTEQIVRQSRRLVEWLKLTQFHLLTPLIG